MMTNSMNHTIDATGKTLGRIASQAAVLLMGKNEVDFAKNKVKAVTVVIENASKVTMTEKRKKTTLHERYSGYPGGLKFQTNEDIISKKGYKELFELAIYGMLPANKLRSRMMKNLTVKE
jgi:large subunit ribosomal protein L13